MKDFVPTKSTPGTYRKFGRYGPTFRRRSTPSVSTANVTYGVDWSCPSCVKYSLNLFFNMNTNCRACLHRGTDTAIGDLSQEQQQRLLALLDMYD